MSTCLPSLPAKLPTDIAVITSGGREFQIGAAPNEKSESVTGCSLCDVQSFEGCLEERDDDVPIKCSCRCGLA